MSAISRSFVTSAFVTVSIVLGACGGGTATVGNTNATNQELQRTKSGGATGDGKTCSWANTTIYDQYGNSAPIPTYSLGDEFKSFDGCNVCDCTDKGIMCTVNKCQPQACDTLAKLCPDGKTSVGRTGPSCEFAPCPGETSCTEDAKKCPDGSYVSRVAPTCEFAPCDGTTDPPAGCPALAKQCPDGSYVGASGPNCEFICPGGGSTVCKQTEDDAATKIRGVVQANLACTIDSDCVLVAIAANCTDQCSAAMAKTGEVDFKNVVDSVNQSLCVDYTKQGCKLIAPACAPSQPPRCVDKKCQ